MHSLWLHYFSPSSVITCPPLPSPDNGQVNTPSQEVGSVANYSCNEGYNLEGVETRTCLQDGSWSGDPPVCTPGRLGNCATSVHTIVVAVSEPEADS